MQLRHCPDIRYSGPLVVCRLHKLQVSVATPRGTGGATEHQPLRHTATLALAAISAIRYTIITRTPIPRVDRTDLELSRF